jgi:hypothetical protein
MGNVSKIVIDVLEFGRAQLIVGKLLKMLKSAG